ncbi:sensor histidine kinase [Streptosporangiaceae bacterium NEAU-GS5]|nr:sensor histidine kinase [Streptosporangiaceae bacterium NEAU-GS5]
MIGDHLSQGWILRALLRVFGVVAFVAAVFRSSPGPGLTGTGLAVTCLSIVVLASGGAALWWSGRPLGQLIVLYGLALAGAYTLILIGLPGPGTAALLVFAWTAAIRLPQKASLPLVAAILAGLVVAQFDAATGRPKLDLVSAVAVIYLLAYVTRLGRANRAAEQREAVLAERARIAREIHDILAHSLSAQLVHLEGARLLLTADRTPEALERVELARDLAKRGLEETRGAIAALRDEAAPLVPALVALAAEFRAATTLDCDLDVVGPERRLGPQAELAVLRTAQEALTNVRRHAPGSPATARLEFGEGRTELEVINKLSDEPGMPGSGYGLVGMRERAELLGGELEAGERDGRFCVRLRLPW